MKNNAKVTAIHAPPDRVNRLGLFVAGPHDGSTPDNRNNIAALRWKTRTTATTEIILAMLNVPTRQIVGKQPNRPNTIGSWVVIGNWTIPVKHRLYP